MTKNVRVRTAEETKRPEPETDNRKQTNDEFLLIPPAREVFIGGLDDFANDEYFNVDEIISPEYRKDDELLD